jgi:uncharacterized RDD family membrane protein YckC
VSPHSVTLGFCCPLGVGAHEFRYGEFRVTQPPQWSGLPPQPHVGPSPYYGPGQAPYGQAPYGHPDYGYGYAPPPPRGLVVFPAIGVVPVASFADRLVARLIDTVITLLAAALIGGLGLWAMLSTSHRTVDSLGGTSSQPTPGGVTVFILSIVLAVLVAICYEWLFIGLSGATPGKMAMGIVVVDEYTAQVIGLGRSALRVVFPTLAGWVVPFAGVIVYLSPLFDSTGRLKGWHDQLAKDFVVKKAALPAR